MNESNNNDCDDNNERDQTFFPVVSIFRHESYIHAHKLFVYNANGIESAACRHEISYASCFGFIDNQQHGVHVFFYTV